MRIMVINGPNINLLGIREQEVYGHQTYCEMINIITKERGEENTIDFFQANGEGELVDEIQRVYFEGYDGIVINPAAYTHTSIAIADALKAVSIPTIEVHLSDIDNREQYRRISFVAEASIARVCGKGIQGYIEAIDILLDYLEKHE